MESLIRLFKAVPIESHHKPEIMDNNLPFVKETIEYGFLLSPEIYSYYFYSDKVREIIYKVSNVLGLTKDRMNATFHKSWGKVANASMFQLIVEQLFHYVTTYGYERLGIYDQNSVYIPAEALEIPDIEEGNIPLVVIKGYTAEEIKEKILGLLTSGIALSKQSIDDVIAVSNAFSILTGENVEQIKNREVKIIVCDQLGLVPADPVEFLRLCVYKKTGKTLLIKDKETIEAIKNNSDPTFDRLLEKYLRVQDIIFLANIFYRFKPIFLAFKTNSKPEVKKKINKIRKLARIHKVPATQPYLDAVTSMIETNKLNISELEKHLVKSNIFRKIRLAQALKYRIKNPESILYKIRNGKAYATKYDSNWDGMAYLEALRIVRDSISKNIEKNVKGKKIYIPSHITYTLPATEKQMFGCVPCMSSLETTTGITVGVNWNNVKHNRIDLDFSLQNIQGQKIGWDGFYRSSGRDILFSGDMTDAKGKNGASEAFSMKATGSHDYLLGLNYFNFNEFSNKNLEVPFKVFVTRQDVKEESKNFVVNPNRLIAEVGGVINTKQRVVGLLRQANGSCKLYLSYFEIGNARSLKNQAYVQHSIRSLVHSCENQLSLKEVLLSAGATLVESAKDCDIDLSLEKLEKDTIINLLK